MALIPCAASAAAAPKTETVAMSWTVVGNDLQLTATTLKHGSAYVDSWSCTPSCSLVASTSLSSDGYFISVATLSAPASGDYEFTYAITMTAGKSDIQWTGENSVIISVDRSDGLLHVKGKILNKHMDNNTS